MNTLTGLAFRLGNLGRDPGRKAYKLDFRRVPAWSLGGDTVSSLATTQPGQLCNSATGANAVCSYTNTVKTKRYPDWRRLAFCFSTHPLAFVILYSPSTLAEKLDKEVLHTQAGHVGSRFSDDSLSGSRMTLASMLRRWLCLRSHIHPSKV